MNADQTVTPPRRFHRAKSRRLLKLLSVFSAAVILAAAVYLVFFWTRPVYYRLLAQGAADPSPFSHQGVATLIIQNVEEFRTVWNQLQPDKPDTPQTIDFNNSAILVVIGDPKRGVGIGIDQVVRKLIGVRATVLTRECPNRPTSIVPYEVIEVPRSGQSIDFKIATIETECSEGMHGGS